MSSTIRAFVGPNGAGKTLGAIATMVAPALASGRTVWANIRINHPNAHLLTTARHLDELHDCVVLFDEMNSVFPSREFSKLPAQVARVLTQLRKGDVQVAWTAPNWARADTIVRECTQLVTQCRGAVPDRWERDSFGELLRDDDGRRQRHRSAWPSNRLFWWHTYDAQDFEEFTLSATKRIKPVKRQMYWRPKHNDQFLYNTLEHVALFDHLDQYGTCINCGGRRDRPRCTCDTGAPKAPSGASAHPPHSHRDGPPLGTLLPLR